MTKKNYETIIIKKEDGVAWIIINRPNKLNTLTLEVIREFSTALKEAEFDKKTRCIIITGMGDKAFCAGADVTMFKGMTTHSATDLSQRGQRLMEKIETVKKPTIAAVNGFCLGGGLELALACDFRIAVEDAQFGCPEVDLGIMPGWGATQRLPKIVGLSRAKELIMLGDRIQASEALEIGLVHLVVSRDGFTEEVKSFAKRLIEKPPISLKHAKHAINYGTQKNLNLGLKIETEAFATLTSTKDFMEGLSAFFEKRKPNFKGE
ncbi:enoyl-CoA hydratase/isomerase family protein [Candidatus Bathyarchaeota archaeon]|nr:enoyl-CoA hydratase/isomerase family protein [Candidatus Bathyarchaeota archaeon]